LQNMRGIVSIKRAVGLLVCCPIIMLLAGCGGSGKPAGIAGLESRDAAVRILAIKWAGENKVSAAVPALVDCLEHEDRAVRFFAIAALKRITETDHGYDYKADARRRAEAVARWRGMVKQEEAK